MPAIFSSSRRRKRNGQWLEHWRPVMGYVYTVIVAWDFVIAPIFFELIRNRNVGLGIWQGAEVVWHPLTLEAGGMFHVAMGAILGITSFMRSRELGAAYTPPQTVQEPPEPETTTTTTT